MWDLWRLAKYQGGRDPLTEGDPDPPVRPLPSFPYQEIRKGGQIPIAPLLLEFRHLPIHIDYILYILSTMNCQGFVSWRNDVLLVVVGFFCRVCRNCFQAQLPPGGNLEAGGGGHPNDWESPIVGPIRKLARTPTPCCHEYEPHQGAHRSREKAGGGPRFQRRSVRAERGEGPPEVHPEDGFLGTTGGGGRRSDGRGGLGVGGLYTDEASDGT